MAENKTIPTNNSVIDFLSKIQNQKLREDCFAILDMMQKVSNSEPVMWGSAIIGFGKLHYVYESGREGDTVAIGFSPRKQNISIYLTGGLSKIEALNFHNWVSSKLAKAACILSLSAMLISMFS